MSTGIDTRLYPFWALVQASDEIGYRCHFLTISGAHLYGFPSADSDFDLRGIHVLPVRELIGLTLGPETIERSATINGVLIETVTHDLRKFCRLLLNRNGYVLEQLYSPLVVSSSPWHRQLQVIARGCITREHWCHYLGFSDNQRLSGQGKEPRLKTLLYVYRVLLSGIYLMRSGNVEANLPRMLDEWGAAFGLEEVRDLIARKVEGGEKAALSREEWDTHMIKTAWLRARLEEEASVSQLPPAVPDDVRARMTRFVVEAR